MTRSPSVIWFQWSRGGRIVRVRTICSKCVCLRRTTVQAYYLSLAWISQPTLYLCSLSSCAWPPSPLRSTVPMSRLPGGGGGGDLGITFLQLWQRVHGPYPAVTGGRARHARSTAPSQRAESKLGERLRTCSPSSRPQVCRADLVNGPAVSSVCRLCCCL